MGTAAWFYGFIFTACLLWISLFLIKALWLHIIIPRLRDWGYRYSDTREPDFMLRYMTTPDIYLLRWHLLPRNRFMNIYLHRMLNSDEGTDLHDHPYANASIILDTGYYEQMKTKTLWRAPGQIILRRAATAHRLAVEYRLGQRSLFEGFHAQGYSRELIPQPAMSLFITGPRTREWGFYTPNGWVPFHKHKAMRDITDPAKAAERKQPRGA